MRRRTFLIVTAGAAAAGAGAIALARVAAPDRFRHYLARLEGVIRSPAARLRHHYAWLDLDPAAADAYVADYEREVRAVGRFSDPPADFYTRFLLSTNFFATQASRPQPRVVYTAFYDPSSGACRNPFSSGPPTDQELR